MENFVCPLQSPLTLPALREMHGTLIDELSQVMTAPDHEFGACLFKLIARIECDFREEENVMEEMDFPALQIHREQHARMLSTLHHLVPKVMQGDFSLARIVVELLPQWFLTHFVKMDTALLAALDSSGVPKHLPFKAISARDLHSNLNWKRGIGKSFRDNRNWQMG